MPQIHPTAILDGEIDLADDVIIGPHCVLTGPITIGAGTRLIGGAWLNGPLTIGESNTIYPTVCLGFAPQDIKWDLSRPGAGLVIGSENIIREGCTMHRATSDEIPTTIGNRGFWLTQAHAGHDSQVGDDCVFANSNLAGHVRVDDRVILGGTSGVHQFCRIGRGAMLSGGVSTSRDVPPFFTLTGISVIGSINMVGMKRSGMPKEDIEDVRWVFKMLYRRGHTHKRAMEELKARADRPMIEEYIEFIESSKRGICAGTGSARRGNTNTET
ncbi:MAG: acyl-ACP--UDP-N-acetylglucosamine O-acyltransferase [Planctomycetota bacterium]|nr:acyl-ACP--UDP-N-acetylglucosamine O-acyltransferase [Planctomycetota bacterium]